MTNKMNESMHLPGTKVTYDRTKKERGEAVVVSKSTAKKNHYYIKDTKNGKTLLVPHHELEAIKENHIKNFFEFRDELKENTMPWVEADKLADKHVTAAMKHKKNGNVAGYHAHSDTANYIMDRLVNTMHPLPVKSTMIAKKSAAAFKKHPIKESMNLMSIPQREKHRRLSKKFKALNDKSKMTSLSQSEREQHRRLARHLKSLTKESTQLDELSTNTLGRYAMKAHNRADIAARMVHKPGDEMDKIANKRSKGTMTAVKKLAARSSSKALGTRTANQIKTGTKAAKHWKDHKDISKAANKNYTNALKNIGKLWDKAAAKRGN